MNTASSRFPVRLVICLFFLWALTSNLLPILIPHFKKGFDLKYFRASLVDWAYWISYFVFAIPSGLLMKKWGYKVTIICGLLLAASGAFLFPLAADARSYSFFLAALFVVASGMTFLETAANPYIKEFGTADTYSQRLNFAQAFNGLGAVVATNVLSHLILSDSLIKSDAAVDALTSQEKEVYYGQIFESVKLPYIVIGGVLVLFVLLFLLTKLPEKAKQKTASFFFNPLRHPRLSRSMAAQFFYVGAQVCVSSFFINYVQDQGIGLTAAKFLLGGLLIAFMIGRYTGAFLMKKYEATQLLMLFALGNVVLSLVIVAIGGMAGVVAFFGVEFLMSIMYPTIFAIGLKGLGERTEMAASYMVMMIIGGALVPLLLGAIADNYASVQWGYAVPLLCFLFIYLYASKEWKVLQQEKTTPEVITPKLAVQTKIKAD